MAVDALLRIWKCLSINFADIERIPFADSCDSDNFHDEHHEILEINILARDISLLYVR